MNTSIQLPSGKILNIARFIALLPASDTDDSSYHLILEGYPHPINLELSDAQTLKKFLELEKNHNIDSTNQSGWDREKQLLKNQRAMELLAKQIEHYKNISDSEAIERQEFFERFKETVDAERPQGQKLYSES